MVEDGTKAEDSGTKPAETDTKPRKKAGRRPILTPKLIDDLYDVVGNNNTIRTACEATGISEGVYHYWISLGEAGNRKHGGIYLDFLKRMQEARALTKLNLVSQITAHGKNDWRAAAWLLERSFQDEYGNREKKVLTGPNDGPIEIKGEPFAVHLIVEAPAE